MIVYVYTQRYVAVSAQNNLLSVCRSKTWRSSRQWKTIRVITWNTLFLYSLALSLFPTYIYTDARSPSSVSLLLNTFNRIRYVANICSYRSLCVFIFVCCANSISEHWNTHSPKFAFFFFFVEILNKNENVMRGVEGGGEKIWGWKYHNDIAWIASFALSG